ncbi:unnamed protein product [Ectocarpus sp. 12 AP-2014]
MLVVALKLSVLIQVVSAWVRGKERSTKTNLKKANFLVSLCLGKACGCLVLVCVASTAAAQNPQELENESLRQFRQEQERLRQQREQLQTSRDVHLQSLDEPKRPLVFPEAETPCFEISEISIEAIERPLQNWEWLYDHIDDPQDSQPVLSRCLGTQGVSVIMARLQQVLVQKGWTTTRIIAPPQDLSSGKLRLDVLEGVISDIRFNQEYGQRATLFNTIPTQAGQVLNLRDIEQGLENFRRVPTVEADISIKPGEEPGQSELLIRHKQALPFRVLASVDDSGNESTGKYQGAFTLSYDNLWTLSDLFYVTFQSELGGKDAGDRGNSGHAVHYSVPWGYSLLSFNSSSTQYHQTVAGAFQDYVYSGTSDQNDARLSRVLQRDQAGKTTAAIRAFHRHSRN